jgi:hypothetical protein
MAVCIQLVRITFSFFCSLQKITFILLAFVALAAFAASAEVDDDLLPWTPGVTVRGVTCAGTVDEEEDLADLIQAGARAVTGNPRSVVSIACS